MHLLMLILPHPHVEWRRRGHGRRGRKRLQRRDGLGRQQRLRAKLAHCQRGRRRLLTELLVRALNRHWLRGAGGVGLFNSVFNCFKLKLSTC